MAKDRFHKFRATARNVGRRAGSARPYADLHGFVRDFENAAHSGIRPEIQSGRPEP